MLCAIDPAGKQEIFAPELSKLYPVDNSDANLLGNFELDRSMCLLLHHNGSWKYARAMGYKPELIN
jgi:hypothetical protein